MIIQAKTYSNPPMQRSALGVTRKTSKKKLPQGLERAIENHEHIIYLTNPGDTKNAMCSVLESGGYEVKTLDFDNILQSVSWNPLRFIYNSEGAKAMTNVFFGPCKGDEESIKIAESAKLFVEASIDFLFDVNNYFDGPKRTRVIEDHAEEDINLKKLARLLDFGTLSLDGSDVTEWQIHFEALRSIKKKSCAVELYDKNIKQDISIFSAGISRAVGVMKPILSPLVKEVFTKDETGLDKIGEKGQALVVVRPKWESNYVPLFNLACQQISSMLMSPQLAFGNNADVHLFLSRDLKGLSSLFERSLDYL